MPRKTFFNLEKNKQKKIIDAALGEFSEKPFSKVTVDSIVNDAGIPKGSFYQYFENKEDLYKHLFQVLSGDKTARLNAVILKIENKSFSEFISELYRKGIEFSFRDSATLSLGEKFMSNCNKELRDEILEIMIHESNELFTKVLNHYLKTGELKEDLNIELAAEMLTTQTIYISRRLRADSSKSKQQVIDAMEDMLSIIEGGILKS